MSGFIGGGGSGGAAASDPRLLLDDTCSSSTRPSQVATSTIPYSSTNNALSESSGVSAAYATTGVALNRSMSFEFDILVAETANTCNLFIQKNVSTTVGVFSWQGDGTAVLYKSDTSSPVGSGFTPTLGRLYRVKITYGVGTEGSVCVTDPSGAIVYTANFTNTLTLARGDSLAININSNKAVSFFRIKKYDGAI